MKEDSFIPESGNNPVWLPNMHLCTERVPFTEPEPDPQTFNVLEVNENTDGTISKIRINKTNIVRYLRALRFVYRGDTPYFFNGMVYEKINPEEIKRIIYALAEVIPYFPDLSRNTVNDIMSQFAATTKADDLEDTAPDDWDREKYSGELIPFSNVLYSPERDEIVPFTPYKFIDHQLNAFFDPMKIHHPVEEIYRKIIPDTDTRRFFFEAVGYSLFSKDLSPPAIFLIYGPGETGKSALHQAIAAAAGQQNVSTLDLAQISGDFTTAELEGKLINVCGETGSGQNRNISKTDGELIKRLSDGQEITVQRKYGHPYQLKNTAKLWFVSNTSPDFGDNSSGLYRRLYVIPCRNKQRWEDQIYSKMTEETAVSWLINKALRGYHDFCHRGRKFDVSAIMESESKSYKIQNGLIDYLNEMYGTIEAKEIAEKVDGAIVSEFYDYYKEYILKCGGKPLSKNKMLEKLRNEFGIETERKSIWDSANAKSKSITFLRKPKEPVRSEPKENDILSSISEFDIIDMKIKFALNHKLRDGSKVPKDADPRQVEILKAAGYLKPNGDNTDELIFWRYG